MAKPKGTRKLRYRLRSVFIRWHLVLTLFRSMGIRRGWIVARKMKRGEKKYYDEHYDKNGVMIKEYDK